MAGRQHGAAFPSCETWLLASRYGGLAEPFQIRWIFVDQVDPPPKLGLLTSAEPQTSICPRLGLFAESEFMGTVPGPGNS